MSEIEILSDLTGIDPELLSESITVTDNAITFNGKVYHSDWDGMLTLINDIVDFE